MPVPTSETVDVTKALTLVLESMVDGLRVEWGPLSTARPPVAVFGLPRIDWQDAAAGFCWGLFDVPLMIAVARSSEREAQLDLSRLVCEVANAFKNAGPIPGIFDIQPLAAEPTTANVNGQELPAYQLRVAVRVS